MKASFFSGQVAMVPKAAAQLATYIMLMALVVACHSQADVVHGVPPKLSESSAAGVAYAAMALPGNATIAAALRLVFSEGGAKSGPETAQTDGRRRAPSAAARVEPALVSLGFRSAIDLQLLGGGPEAAELLDDLRAKRGLSIADRAKIRLLLNDQAHLARFRVGGSRGKEDLVLNGLDRRRDQSRLMTTSMCSKGPGGAAASGTRQMSGSGRRARLQEMSPTSESGISVDTIAIVLSVLVGAAGCKCHSGTVIYIGLEVALILCVCHRCHTGNHGEARRADTPGANAGAAGAERASHCT
eukprot:SAG31_NODE_2242_length_6109_cov_18.408819_6_plen_300_part_00